MWTAEFIESNGSSKTYYIKGPKFTIGRNDGVDLAFSAEKSISRRHCEISISTRSTNSDCCLSLKDLNSRFGTFVNDQKLAAGETVTCNESQQLVVRLGVASWRIVISKKVLKLCATRLEKSEKELLKARSELLGAVIVQSTSAATHLVTSKATATVKFLTALVSRSVKIVNLAWLQFAETTASIQLINDEVENFPESSDDAVLVQPTASRDGIFASLHVLLLHPTDGQYVELFLHCGALVTKVYDLMQQSGDNWSDIMKQVLQNHRSRSGGAEGSAGEGGNERKLCIFYDEISSPVAPVKCLEQLQAAHSFPGSPVNLVYYITAAITAGSIMELRPPTLLVDSPFPGTMPSKSSSAQASDDLFREDDNAGAALVSNGQVSSSVAKATVVKEEVMESAVTAETKPDVQIAGPAAGDSSAKTKLAADADQPPFTTNGSGVSGRAGGATKRRRNQEWLMSDDEDEEEGLRRKGPALKRPCLQAPQSSAGSSVDDSKSKSSCGVSGMKENVAGAGNSDWLADSVGSRGSNSASIKKEAAKPAVDVDEWISIEKQLEGVELDKKEEDGAVQPVLVLRKESSFSAHSLASSASRDSSSDSAVNGIKNVKKFTKNIIKRVEEGERVSLKTTGYKVLPKQSERELQLRLEFEQLQAKQQLAEAMFSDNFGGNANKKGKRKGV